MYQSLRNLSIAFLLLGLLACDNSAKEAAAWEAKMNAGMTELDTAQEALTAKRTEHATLATAGDEESITKAKELEKEIDTLATDLKQKVADYLFEIDTDIYEKEKKSKDKEIKIPKPAQYMTATRILSSENLVVAKQYIDRAGDYRRAIRVYEDSLAEDPDNSDLKEAKAWAETMMYMSEERLSGVKKDMTEEEVVATIGQVDRNLIKEFPEKKTTAWFFPREDGGTAAVYFLEKKGVKKVFKADYHAKDPEKGADE